MDPHLVLGGPLDTPITSMVDNSRAFVVTYPLNSDERVRQNVVTWEAEFLKVAEG